jgi:hypothetical protein
MSIPLAILILYGIALLVLVVMTTIYGARPHDIDYVILLARRLDLSDLEVLLDAATEWNLRRSLNAGAFRSTQEDRIRLVREYLRRVDHNAGLIQLWLMREKALFWNKKPEDYSARERLVVEAFDLAMEIRFHWLGANSRTLLWILFRAHRWPRIWIPRVSDLRIQNGIDILRRYRRLTELAITLSALYGQTYHDRLLEAL